MNVEWASNTRIRSKKVCTRGRHVRKHPSCLAGRWDSVGSSKCLKLCHVLCIKSRGRLEALEMFSLGPGCLEIRNIQGFLYKAYIAIFGEG